MADNRPRFPHLCRLAAAGLTFALAAAGFPAAAEDLDLDLSDTPLPLVTFEDLPSRAGPFIELGRGINETGPLSPGIELPTGAVWQPALWIYGAQRLAVLATDGDRRTRRGGDYSEVMTRMDLFANLQLSGTERVLAHVRPMDKGGRFAGRRLGPSGTDTGWETDWDADLETAFFEGDLGELFPRLDPDDRRSGDIGFVFGKFPVEFQNGYMVRDEMMAVGLAQANLQMDGSSGIRLAGLWAFDDVDEPDRTPDERDVHLLGLFLEGNFPWGLLELDIAGTAGNRDRGKQVNAGVGWTDHAAGHNYSVYLNLSQHFDQVIDAEQGLNIRPNGEEKDYDGLLAVVSYSTETNLRRDLLYATGYWAEGDFERLASNATPTLGPVGLSFAGVGLGGYRPALWPRSLNSVGGAVGYQMFFNQETTNWVIEVAHRHDRAKDDPFGDTGGTAVTTRLQQKIFSRMMLQLDAYYAVLADDDRGPQDAESDNETSAVRVELRFAF